MLLISVVVFTAYLVNRTIFCSLEPLKKIVVTSIQLNNLGDVTNFNSLLYSIIGRMNFM